MFRARTSGPVLLAVMALVAACSGGGGDEGSASGAAEEPTRRDCRVDELPGDDPAGLTGDDPVGVAVEVASATHRCADVVVLAPAADGWAGAVAAPVALAEEAPLLLVGDGGAADLAPVVEELDAWEVVAVGVGADGLDVDVTELAAAPVADDAAAGGADAASDGEQAEGADAGSAADGPAGPDRALPAPTALGLAVADHVGADRLVAVAADDPDVRLALAGHLDEGTAVVPVAAGDEPLDGLADAVPDEAEVVVLATTDDRAADLVERLGAAGVDAAPVDGPVWPGGPGGTVWLADGAQPATAAVVAVAAAGRGDVALPIDAGDLRRPPAAARVREAAPERVLLVGAVTDAADWQLPVVLEGPPLPHGGFTLFDDHRIVALYGHPGAGSLGALGQQDLDATVGRARDAAAPYETAGTGVLPGFEIITTVASGSPTATGDYSSRTAIDDLRPWIDRAADEGFYVLLDLQPGRTDFLTQAKEYEELLREPHVGLALDPEWRLAPDQVHLRQIGSVGAAEVQSVVDWLAGLTRDHLLPEKLLLLHQFRHSMLPDREEIRDVPELAIVVQMDGWGPLHVKDSSYRAITEGAEDRWLWGWKNFYVDDTPLAPPERTLSLDPTPVFVSYQ